MKSQCSCWYKQSNFLVSPLPTVCQHNNTTRSRVSILYSNVIMLCCVIRLDYATVRSTLFSVQSPSLNSFMRQMRGEVSRLQLTARRSQCSSTVVSALAFVRQTSPTSTNFTSLMNSFSGKLLYCPDRILYTH